MQHLNSLGGAASAQTKGTQLPSSFKLMQLSSGGAEYLLNLIFKRRGFSGDAAGITSFKKMAELSKWNIDPVRPGEPGEFRLHFPLVFYIRKRGGSSGSLPAPGVRLRLVPQHGKRQKVSFKTAAYSKKIDRFAKIGRKEPDRNDV